MLAAPAYLARHGHPTHPADLTRHRTITHVSAGHLNRWRFLIDGQLTPHAPRGDFSASSTWLVIEMVLAGLGLGWINTQLVEPQLQRGELVEVLAPFRDPSCLPVYTVMLPDRDRLPRIRAVVEFLAGVLGQKNHASDA